ncbi:MBL fold metallo-hydrolase [Candidatus Hodarchaeum mangrovi]
MINYEGITFKWLGHDGFLITSKTGQTICIDPYEVKGDFKPVNILISTHEHGDHCSPADLAKFTSSDTIIFGIEAAKDKLAPLKKKSLRIVKPNFKEKIDSIVLEFVPAYNVNKFRSPGKPFHPKEDNKVGVILTIDGVRVYHAGDTDKIPEMKYFKSDVALLPVSGTYVMTAKEAIEATAVLQPKLVIPMHFGAIVGDKSMAKEFKEGVSCEVIIPSL